MREIDVTNIVQAFIDGRDSPMRYSASRVELGQNAGEITWAEARSSALALFGESFDREAFNAFFEQSGGWNADELAAHSDKDSAALMLQFVVGDWRECQFDEYADADENTPAALTPEWWELYGERASEGQVSSRFFLGSDSRIYYSLD